jgi:hypothetical protein
MNGRFVPQAVLEMDGGAILYVADVNNPLTGAAAGAVLLVMPGGEPRTGKVELGTSLVPGCVGDVGLA